MRPSSPFDCGRAACRLLLLAVALLLLPDMAASIRPRRWLIFGALAGVGALTNTTLLSVFPFFWLWLWISDRRRGLSPPTSGGSGHQLGVCFLRCGGGAFLVSPSGAFGAAGAVCVT